MRTLGAVAIALTLMTRMTAAAQSELIDRTLAIVAGQVITLSDVRAAVTLGLVEGAASGDALAATTKRLVDRAVALREVQRYAPPEPAEAAVSARIQTIVNRFGSLERFREVLASVAMNEPALDRWVRDDLRLASYLDQRFASAESVERRAELVTDWIADLRRRTPVIELIKN
jgi:hypothetical protein